MDDLMELEARMQIATGVGMVLGLAAWALMFWLAGSPWWGTAIGLFIFWFCRQAFKAPYDAEVERLKAVPPR